MGKAYLAIDESLSQWISRQKLFFVATAPLAASGHVNCSPKGGDTLRVLGPNEVAYLDGAGSGIETVAHLRENARMVIMLCAFDGPPRIVRLHGVGTVLAAGEPGFQAMLENFAPYRTVRAIIHLAVSRVSDSCGYGVPFMDFRAERGDSAAYVRKSSDTVLQNYLIKNNERSVDGLTGMTADELRRVVIGREP
jgi:Pyridoxamine 5'-phosphate oxidase